VDLTQGPNGIRISASARESSTKPGQGIRKCAILKNSTKKAINLCNAMGGGQVIDAVKAGMNPGGNTLN